MEWKSITPDEAKTLKYATGTGNGSSYKELFEAVAKGPVRIDVAPDKLQSLKACLSRAIKQAGAHIVVATLADKTGVVLNRKPEEPAKK